MRRLIVIGAGLMGREASTWAVEAGFSVAGFLDSRQTVLQGFNGYPPIIGTVDDYEPNPGDEFVCAIGDPVIKARYAQIMMDKGAVFATVVHPRAYVGRNVVLGRGCIIAPHATLTNDICIADHVIVNINASLSHDCRIGAWTTICPGCSLAGLCRLGKGVFVGIGATMIPSVELGDGVFVAAGAVVTQSFSRGRIMGVPAILRE